MQVVAEASVCAPNARIGRGSNYDDYNVPMTELCVLRNAKSANDQACFTPNINQEEMQ